jgi:arginine deiminase
LVALKGGVVYGYERNEYTAQALEKAGYEVWAASGLTKEFKDYTNAMGEMENIFITIPSAELSRARGGPHCMTMPIERF